MGSSASTPQTPAAPAGQIPSAAPRSYAHIKPVLPPHQSLFDVTTTDTLLVLMGCCPTGRDLLAFATANKQTFKIFRDNRLVVRDKVMKNELRNDPFLAPFYNSIARYEDLEYSDILAMMAEARRCSVFRPVKSFDAAKRNINRLHKISIMGEMGTVKFQRPLTSLPSLPFLTLLNLRIGVEFRVYSYFHRGDLVKLQLWELAGNRTYGNIITSYIRGHPAFMLMFSIHEPEHFAKVQSHWLPLVEQHRGSNSTFVIVGTRRKNQKRAVPFKEAHGWAQKRGYPYIEADVSEFVEVEVIFQLLACAVDDAQREVLEEVTEIK